MEDDEGDDEDDDEAENQIYDDDSHMNQHESRDEREYRYEESE